MIHIITDSISDLGQKLIGRHQIEIAPLTKILKIKRVQRRAGDAMP
jgi:fatty acid-binding protein DegV